MAALIKLAALCAVAGVQLSGIDPIYQIYKAKHSGNIRPIPFIAMILNGVLWTNYAFLVGDGIVLVSNVASFLFGSVYFTIFCVYSSAEIRKYYMTRLAQAALLLLFGLKLITMKSSNPETLIGFVGCLGVTFMMGSPLISMQRVCKEKSTESMSLPMAIAITFNGFSWTSYGFLVLNGDLFIVVPNVIGFLAGCTQIALFMLYPSTKQHHEPKETGTAKDFV